MGDVCDDRIYDIWMYSSRYKEIRESLLRGDRTESQVCSRCDFSGFKRIPNPITNYQAPMTSPDRTFRELLMEKAIAITNRI